MKLYERAAEDEVLLVPDTDAAGFEPIVVRATDGEVRVVAEFVEVLPGGLAR